MQFVGIIEKDNSVVQEIILYLSGNEKCCLLFTCQTMEDFRLLPLSKKNRANIILVNTDKNNFDRLWQIKYLKQVNPRSKIVVLLENWLDDPLAERILHAGATAYLQKSFVADKLPLYMEKVLNRESIEYSSGMVVHDNRAVVNGAGEITLTAREIEIIEMVAKGYSNKKIGEVMHISTYTVNAHLRKIYIKLSVNSRTELIRQIINTLV